MSIRILWDPDSTKAHEHCLSNESEILSLTMIDFHEKSNTFKLFELVVKPERAEQFDSKVKKYYWFL